MKLFQRLLIAPAALGLLAPVAANADVVNVEELSAGSFSSATKLSGSSVFTTGFIDTTNTNDNKLTSQFNFKLDLNTSFTGSDNLYTAIDAGNQGPNATDLVMDSSVTGGTGLNVDKLHYTFPVGDFEVTAGPLMAQDDVISATTSIYSDAFRLGSAPWSAEGEEGAGAAIQYIADNGWNGSFNVIAVGAATSTTGAFTEEGQDVWTASVGYDAENYGGGIVFKNDDQIDESVSVGVYFRPEGMPTISVVYDKLDDNDAIDSSDLLIGLDYPVNSGVLSGAYQVRDTAGVNTTNYEVYYNYPINDGVAVQGGLFVEEVNGADNTQGVVVETFFSF